MSCVKPENDQEVDLWKKATHGWTSKLGAGEWQQEPDKVQWTDDATGLVC
jgi:hypothetical protein